MNDVRVIELTECLDLPLEALLKARVLSKLGRQDFDRRHAAARRRLRIFAHQIHSPHGAAAALLFDDPVAEPFADHGKSEGRNQKAEIRYRLDDVSIFHVSQHSHTTRKQARPSDF